MKDNFKKDIKNKISANTLKYNAISEKDKLKIIDEIIFLLIEKQDIDNKEDFHKLKNSVYKKYKLPQPIPWIAFIERFNNLIDDNIIKYSQRLHKLFRKRAVRSLSWVAVISLLTKEFWCPWKCVFCPTYEWLPKSYITNEPAVMRAELNDFDAVKQIQNRLRSLEITGHNITKCDVRVIWWTWSVYPKEYKDLFMKEIYDAHTTYSDLRPFIEATSIEADKFALFKVRQWYKMKSSKTLKEAQDKNEKANSRVIWIAIETRPDWLDVNEVKELREYWVTRVEIWYQTTFDKVNLLNRRWHWNKESKFATKILKDAWFKVVAHLMPNLLWSTPDMDRESCREVFDNQDYRPDEIKIYPTMVMPHSELEWIWRSWDFKPYDDETLVNLMADLQWYLPEYVRLNRLYRDIPWEEIIAWSLLANLRQVTDKKMKEKWIKLKDISSREIRDKWNNPENAKLHITEYKANWWIEYLLEFRDPEDKTIFSLLRLRVPSQIFTKEKHFIKELENSAIIREVHTYWDQLRIWEKPDWTWQHMWFWKRLIKHAEDLIQEKYPNISRMAVISWVWVRWYYEKWWYKLEWTYMIKLLKR